MYLGSGRHLRVMPLDTGGLITGHVPWLLCKHDLLQWPAGGVVTTRTVLSDRYSEYELRPGGADIAIDGGDCAAYVAAVVDATLGSGIARQVCCPNQYQGSCMHQACVAALHAGHLPRLWQLSCGR